MKNIAKMCKWSEHYGKHVVKLRQIIQKHGKVLHELSKTPLPNLLAITNRSPQVNKPLSLIGSLRLGGGGRGY